MRTLRTIALCALVVFPSITNAAWWNPIDWWHVFFPKPPVATVATTTIPSIKETVTTNVVKKPVEKKALVERPSVEKTAAGTVIPMPAPEAVVDYEAMYTDVLGKYVTFRDSIDKSPVMESKADVNHARYLRALYDSMNADIKELSNYLGKPKPGTIVLFYRDKYAQIMRDNDTENRDYIRNQTVEFVRENRETLHVPDKHTKLAFILNIYDRTFGTRYGDEFKTLLLPVETVEWADGFLLDHSL